MGSRSRSGKREEESSGVHEIATHSRKGRESNIEEGEVAGIYMDITVEMRRKGAGRVFGMIEYRYFVFLGLIRIRCGLASLQ